MAIVYFDSGCSFVGRTVTELYKRNSWKKCLELMILQSIKVTLGWKLKNNYFFLQFSFGIKMSILVPRN